MYIIYGMYKPGKQASPHKRNVESGYTWINQLTSSVVSSCLRFCMKQSNTYLFWEVEKRDTNWIDIHQLYQWGMRGGTQWNYFNVHNWYWNMGWIKWAFLTDTITRHLPTMELIVNQLAAIFIKYWYFMLIFLI
jgi:hypothetical protein